MRVGVGEVGVGREARLVVVGVAWMVGVSVRVQVRVEAEVVVVGVVGVGGGVGVVVGALIFACRP